MTDADKRKTFKLYPDERYVFQLIQRNTGQRSDAIAAFPVEFAETLQGTELDVRAEDETNLQAYILVVLAEDSGQVPQFPLMTTRHFIEYCKTIKPKESAHV